MRRPLNLARRPFANERLPTLLLGLGCLLLLGITVRHAMAAWQLLPEKTAAVDGELVALEREIESLRARSEDLREHSAPDETLHEWAAVGALVDRRAFSWAALLGCLEETMPQGVRLRTITPGGRSGALEVNLRAVASGVEDAWEFLGALRERREFEDAFLTSVSETSEGIVLAYTMRYAPGQGAEGPSAEEPSAEEPVAQEPVAQEPVAQEAAS